jgi:hypothetical protein
VEPFLTELDLDLFSIEENSYRVRSSEWIGFDAAELKNQKNCFEVSGVSDFYHLDRPLPDLIGQFSFFESIEKDGFSKIDIYQHMNEIYHLEEKNGAYSSVYSVFMMDLFFDKYMFGHADDLLRSIDVQRLTGWSIVALLRSTSMVKHLLPSWGVFYRESREHLIEIKEDVDELLWGLDD